MNLGFFRRPASLRQKNSIATPMDGDRSEVADCRGVESDAEDAWLPDEFNPEGVRPLYASSVYHSELEELPTFAARYVNETTQSQILSLMGVPNVPPIKR